jgi:hypothetical protein
MKMVADMGQLGSSVTLAPRSSVVAAWIRAIKRTIARFTRGNIAAQKQRILLPEEQERKHAQARAIASKMRERRAA